MTDQICVCGCGQPSADGYAAHRCARELASALRSAAGHAEDAEAVIARQTRYGGGSRGGSDEPLPVDLTAATRFHAVAGVVNGWAGVLVDEGYAAPVPRWRAAAGPLCPPPRAGHEPPGYRCGHATCEAIRDRTPPSPLAALIAWLAGHVDELRKHPAAGEAFGELHDACRQLARLVDRPDDRQLVGVCDCGKVLYAPRGKDVIHCPIPTCRLRWNVAESRDILRRHLGDKLVTAAEAARLATYLDGDRTQDNIRKLIAARVKSGQLAAHGQVEVEGEVEPTYRFGEVAALLAGIPRRERRAA